MSRSPAVRAASYETRPEGVYREGVHRIGFFEAVAGIRRNSYIVRDEGIS